MKNQIQSKKPLELFVVEDEYSSQEKKIFDNLEKKGLINVHYRPGIVGDDYSNMYFSKIIPHITQQNLIPLSNKEIMENKLEAFYSKDQDKIKFWLEQGFSTTDAIVSHEGNIIVIPKSEFLLNIKEELMPKNKLLDNGLILGDNQYKKLKKEYEVLNIKGMIMRKNLYKNEAKNHPIWLKIVQEDKGLLNEYVDFIFSEDAEKLRFDYGCRDGEFLPLYILPFMNKEDKKKYDRGITGQMGIFILEEECPIISPCKIEELSNESSLSNAGLDLVYREPLICKKMD